MTWSNPFRRPDAHTRTAYGYAFQLTEQHLTRDQMDPMKQFYDMLGEKAWEKLDSMSPQPPSTLPPNAFGGEAEPALRGNDEKSSEGKRDIYVLLQQNTFKDEALGQLWAEVNTVPSWVCWDQIGDQIARGQDCFYRYGGPVLTGLAFQSLLGGTVILFGLLN